MATTPLRNQYQEFKPQPSEAWRARIDEEWRTFSEPITAIAERVSGWLERPEDDRLRHELYRYIMLQLSTGYLYCAYGDTEHPDFSPFISNAFNTFIVNPDFLYPHTPVDDDGVYRITGTRGTVRAVDFQLGNGSLMARGMIDGNLVGGNVANYDLDRDVTLGEDGTFDVVLSAERPEGHDGDWWHLPPTATYLMARQVSYDWLAEEDGNFAIDRLDRPARKPRTGVEQLAEQLRNIVTHAEDLLDVTADWSRRFTQHAEANEMKYSFPKNFALLPAETQRYVWGRWDLAPDEALIIEATATGEARYWGVCLYDHLGYGVDWMHRQSTLNGHTATPDADGAHRFVVAGQDPGVPNWLDNGEYEQGMICMRYQLCETYPDLSTKVVRLADVRDHLPADTPVVDAAQRDATIRLRRRGLQSRRKW
jgi:hypothetical protein